MESIRPASPVSPIQPTVERKTPTDAPERVDSANDRERERSREKRRAREKKKVTESEEPAPESPLGKKVDIRA